MNLSQVIIGPVVTEKAMKLASDQNYHTIFVHPQATKLYIKTTLKKYYDVDVAAVKIIKMPSKTRVRGTRGPQIKRKPRVKALVKLKTGTLDLLKIKSTTVAKTKVSTKK